MHLNITSHLQKQYVLPFLLPSFPLSVELEQSLTSWPVYAIYLVSMKSFFICHTDMRVRCVSCVYEVLHACTWCFTRVRGVSCVYEVFHACMRCYMRVLVRGVYD